METNQAHDLNINGVSSAAGGHYRKVKIEGVGRLAGDVRSAEFVVNGMVTIQGNLETERFTANGKQKIEGSLDAAESNIEGFVTVSGSLNGERFTMRGLLKAGGDCAFESFDAEGGFEIGGLLNAGAVNLTLHAKTTAREIGCETLRVRKAAKSQWKLFFQKMFARWSPQLEVEIIEGDDIDLQHTVASVVRGNRVVIGPGCRIGCVEYRSEIVKHPGVHVGEERKTGDGSHLA